MINKVLAYVTRDDHLLLLRHCDFPEASLQVPAGRIEESENPNDAVLREVYEESGLQQVRVVQLLGRYFHDTALYWDEIQGRHVYHAETTSPVESEWLHYENHPSSCGLPYALSFFWTRLGDPELTFPGKHGEPSPQAHIEEPKRVTLPLSPSPTKPLGCGLGSGAGHTSLPLWHGRPH